MATTSFPHTALRLARPTATTALDFGDVIRIAIRIGHLISDLKDKLIISHKKQKLPYVRIHPTILPSNLILPADNRIVRLRFSGGWRCVIALAR